MMCERYVTCIAMGEIDGIYTTMSERWYIHSYMSERWGIQ